MPITITRRNGKASKVISRRLMVLTLVVGIAAVGAHRARLIHTQGRFFGL
jgi:hypothetical protein